MKDYDDVIVFDSTGTDLTSHFSETISKYDDIYEVNWIKNNDGKKFLVINSQTIRNNNKVLKWIEVEKGF